MVDRALIRTGSIYQKTAQEVEEAVFSKMGDLMANPLIQRRNGISVYSLRPGITAYMDRVDATNQNVLVEVRLGSCCGPDVEPLAKQIQALHEAFTHIQYGYSHHG